MTTLPFSLQPSVGDLGDIWVQEGISCGYKPRGISVGWCPHYLNVLPEKVCVEAEPVGGDIKPSLDENVSLECTGANCKAERESW